MRAANVLMEAGQSEVALSQGRRAASEAGKAKE